MILLRMYAIHFETLPLPLRLSMLYKDTFFVAVSARTTVRFLLTARDFVTSNREIAPRMVGTFCQPEPVTPNHKEPFRAYVFAPRRFPPSVTVGRP